MRIISNKIFFSLQILIFCSNIKAKNKPPVTFTENKGQVSDQNYKRRTDVLFGGKANGLVYHLRNNGISYQLNRVDNWKSMFTSKKLSSDKSIKVPDQVTIYRLDINWLQINKNYSIQTEELLEGTNNYYLESCPNGVTGVKTYAGVFYNNIYDNINLHYYQKGDNLKYDFIVKPGGNYNQIQLEVKGARNITLQKDNSLVFTTPLGEIKEDAPLVFQDGKQLNAKWKVKNNIVGFEIENYDSEKELIIDPNVRLWGTYYGDLGAENGFSCATDANNNVYLTGSINYSSGTVIATTGAHQTVSTGGTDAYLVKFASNGVRLWGTLYGGSITEDGTSCSTDINRNVFMAGYTNSNGGTAIATNGSHQPNFGGGVWDAFLVKFDSNGVRQWGTYYGGNGIDYGNGCVADASGNVYLTGETTSNTGTVIATPSSHQPSFGGSSGGDDAYLVKFSPNGIRLWGTYYGGTLGETGYSVDVDTGDNIYMTGISDSNNGTVIATNGSHQPSFGGGAEDAFLVKFDSNGNRKWGTYYGGIKDDYGYSCATDLNDNIYLIGKTNSTVLNVISTNGCHQPTFGGGASDAFLVKFNKNGQRQWGTYYGGTLDDLGYSGCTEKKGSVYIGGYTGSNTGTVIATQGSHQPVHGGFNYTDAFLVKFDSVGLRKAGTYYGGTGSDEAYSCTSDSSGNVYLCGNCNTITGTIIATSGSHQPLASGGGDAFLVKFSNCDLPNPPLDSTSISNKNICSNKSATLTLYGGSINVNWFATASSTNIIGSGNTFVTPTLGLGTYTYYAEASTCKASLRTPITVTVNPNPNITVNSGVICIGNSFTIIPTGANTYTIQGGTTIVSPTMNTSYTVVGTSTAGCTATTISVASVTVSTVIPTISVNSGSICSGKSFTIIPSGANTYTIQGGNFVVSPNTNSSYTVIGTSTAGCVSSTFVTSNVTVNTTPTISVNSGSICLGNTFTIIPNGASTYTFQGGTPFVSPSANAFYTVVGTSSGGCLSSSYVTSNVTVFQTNITSFTSNSIICGPPFQQTSTLTANGASTYTWSNSANGSTIVISPTITTTYTVTGTDANGCSNSDTITQNVSTCTSINGLIINSFEFSIYPNPTNGEFVITINNLKENCFIEVYNNLGQIVIRKPLVDLNTKINLGKEANGVYFVRIKTDGKEIYQAKVIKQ